MQLSRKNKPLDILLLLTLFLSVANSFAQVQVWRTDPDQSVLFESQTTNLAFENAANGNQTIEVNESERFQTMDGFGCCLTGGSALHLIRMSASSRAALLKELFATDGTNIGISYLRLSIGASDLNDHAFSYDDLPVGRTDANMTNFSLDPDRGDVIPVLKEILAINPTVKILGSPWSPPAWMKDNHDTRGGSLKPEFYDAYAKYFVKYIEEMKA